jgi:hypothetical protein
MLKWIAGLVLALFTTSAAAHDEPVIGTLAGAGIGAAVAGPPGAAVGAVLGAIIGATTAHETDHGPNGHGHRHHGRVRYKERVAYHGNGNGHSHVNGAADARCEPERAYYRPVRVRVEERPVTVRTVTTQTKMKKVCRYQPVKTTRVTERRATERVVVASR